MTRVACPWIVWNLLESLGVFVEKLGMNVELEFAHAMVAAVWVFSNDASLDNVYLIIWTTKVFSFLGPKLSEIVG